MSKICCVCGYKAYGKNFGVITCDPCKAFFRRNALRNNFVCLFDGNCNINQITRKFCQKCRLEKCFSVGMKKEHILNEEERHLRRLKIEINRQQRKSSFCSATDSDSNSTEIHESDKSVDSNLRTDRLNQNIITNDFLIEVLENNSITTEQINQQIMEIENSIPISSNKLNDISQDVYQKVVDFELSVIPIPRLISQQKPNEFNNREIQILSELLSATHLIRQPVTKITNEITNMADLRKVMSYKYDRDIKCFVKALKSLRSFSSLCENDRIILLKNQSFTILLMRSIMFFNNETEDWTLFMDENNSILVKLELLKKFRHNIYEAFKNYFQKIIPVWDSDTMIVDLLTAIILFNSDRQNLIHKEVIKLKQHIYMHLLQRHLEIKYQSECESKSKFLKLMNTLIDINVLGEVQKKNVCERNPKELSPLLQEMLDLKPQNSIHI